MLDKKHLRYRCLKKIAFWVLPILCYMHTLLAFSATIQTTCNQWSIDGVSADQEKNIRLKLSELCRQQDTQTLTEEAFYLATPNLVQKALQPFGYFHAKIQFLKQKIYNLPRDTIHITLGQPVKIHNITVTLQGDAQTDLFFASQIRTLSLQKGNTFNAKSYKQAKDQLTSLASTRGYFNAKIVLSQIKINLINNTADIHIIFNSGKRYRINHTVFSHTSFDTAFLKKFLNYHSQDFYTYQALEKAKKNFLQSRYFSVVKIEPVVEKEQLNINIFLQEKKHYAYTLGPGYGTDTGFRLHAVFENRRLTHHGHQVKIEAQAAERDNSFGNILYTIPGKHPTQEAWSLQGNYTHFNEVNSDSGKSMRLESAYTYLPPYQRMRVALTFLNEHYSITGFPHTETTLIYPNINWRYSRKSSEVHPKTGFLSTFFLAGTPLGIFSKKNFFQARFSIKSLFTFSPSWRLLLRSDMAHTHIRTLESLPLSLQLFAGGANSIRGYRYNQIGPAKNLLVGSIELQYQVKKHWYLSGFVDGGSVYGGNTTKNTLTNRLNLGAGPGLAWESPIGSLEFSLAKAFSTPSKPWVIQFTIGSSF